MMVQRIKSRSSKYIIILLLFFKCLKLIHGSTRGFVQFPQNHQQQQQVSNFEETSNQQQLPLSPSPHSDWIKTVPKFTEDTLSLSKKIFLYDNTSLNTGS